MEWIVIVSQTGAKMFEQDRDGNLDLIDTVSNPMGRAKNRELMTEKPGLNRGKQRGSSPHGMIGKKNPHEDIVLKFIKKLGKHLKLQLARNDGLVLRIVADAKLTGLLKDEFSRTEMAQITWTKKNVEKVPRAQWPGLLQIQKVKRRPNANIRLRS